MDGFGFGFPRRNNRNNMRQGLARGRGVRQGDEIHNAFGRGPRPERVRMQNVFGRGQMPDDDQMNNLRGNLDEQGQNELRAAIGRHEQRLINQDICRIAANTEETKAEVAGIERIRQDVSFRKAQADLRDAEIRLEKEQDELDVQEQINIIRENQR